MSIVTLLGILGLSVIGAKIVYYVVIGIDRTPDAIKYVVKSVKQDKNIFIVLGIISLLCLIGWIIG